MKQFYGKKRVLTQKHALSQRFQRMTNKNFDRHFLKNDNCVWETGVLLFSSVHPK